MPSVNVTQTRLSLNYYLWSIFNMPGDTCMFVYLLIILFTENVNGCLLACTTVSTKPIY